MKRSAEAGALVWRSVNGLPKILVTRAAHEWIFPRGHVGEDERPQRVALREVEKETVRTGRIVCALQPARGRVQYYSVAAFDEGETNDERRRWLDPEAAIKLLSHKETQKLLRESLRDIEEDAALLAWQGPSPTDTTSEDPFDGFLTSEYEHVADSLLRNEEDGEKRGTFFLTVVGAIGAALTFLIGETPDLQPDSVSPWIAGALLLMLIVGYVTFARVITRNIATDRYKAALRRIRRYFLNGPRDPKAMFLAFDPLKRDTRPPVSLGSIGRGGWLEMVMGVESVVFGALVASVVNMPRWRFDILVAIAAAAVAWAVLVHEANRRYRDARR